MRFDTQGRNPQTLVNTGGRPLGLDFDPHGNLIITDAAHGMLWVTPDGQLKVLTTCLDGRIFE